MLAPNYLSSSRILNGKPDTPSFSLKAIHLRLQTYHRHLSVSAQRSQLPIPEWIWSPLTAFIFGDFLSLSATCNRKIALDLSCIGIVFDTVSQQRTRPIRGHTCLPPFLLKWSQIIMSLHFLIVSELHKKPPSC